MSPSQDWNCSMDSAPLPPLSLDKHGTDAVDRLPLKPPLKFLPQKILAGRCSKFPGACQLAVGPASLALDWERACHNRTDLMLVGCLPLQSCNDVSCGGTELPFQPLLRPGYTPANLSMPSSNRQRPCRSPLHAVLKTIYIVCRRQEKRLLPHCITSLQSATAG